MLKVQVLQMKWLCKQTTKPTKSVSALTLKSADKKLLLLLLLKLQIVNSANELAS